MVPNLYYVLKHGQLKFNWMGWIVRPGVATAAMGLVVFILRELLPVNRLWTLVEVLGRLAVYIGIALLVKAITPEDLRSFRGVTKSINFARRSPPCFMPLPSFPLGLGHPN